SKKAFPLVGNFSAGRMIFNVEIPASEHNGTEADVYAKLLAAIEDNNILNSIIYCTPNPSTFLVLNALGTSSNVVTHLPNGVHAQYSDSSYKLILNSDAPYSATSQSVTSFIGYLPSTQDFANIFSMDGTNPGYPGGFETPINVTQFDPPVKPQPSASEAETQLFVNAASASGTKISSLPPVVDSTTTVTQQMEVNETNAAGSSTQTYESVGTYTTTEVKTINQPINQSNVNPSPEDQKIADEMLANARATRARLIAEGKLDNSPD
ncbi:MAG: hypothetical protein EBU90_20040, partial [Proteobacteria bacterium]|nr:hypothetical protein [Pseudomonadota bacterium]